LQKPGQLVLQRGPQSVRQLEAPREEQPEQLQLALQGLQLALQGLQPLEQLVPLRALLEPRFRCHLR
jgi:hypothetical protein